MNKQLKKTINWLYTNYMFFKRRAFPYKPLAVFGPEHEFSVINEELKPLPIVDQIIKDFCGKIVDFVYTPRFTFGKEASLQIMEIKAKTPFKSAEIFEETMQNAVSTLWIFLKERYQARLVGTGMHPLLNLEDTQIWPHSNQDIIEDLGKIFNLKRHGWLNIQSFQLNLPYSNEKKAVSLYNALTHLCAYLPAISASSPIYEGKLGRNVDNRLHHYKMKKREIPSMSGDVVPEYISSFNQFRKNVVGKYSEDLRNVGAGPKLLYSERDNLRSLIFRFNREAIEIKIMDEQECIKSDVALSCFIRAATRGLLAEQKEPPSHQMLVDDYTSIVENGLRARVAHPSGETARGVCQHFFRLASQYAKKDEKKYLWIVKKRIEKGNLSELIRERVLAKAQKTSFKEAIVSTYLKLSECLSRNQPYF
jgi:carboxylate-amine ligase